MRYSGKFVNGVGGIEASSHMIYDGVYTLLIMFNAWHSGVPVRIDVSQTT